MPSCKWLLFESLSQHIQTSGASKTAQRHFNCSDSNEPILNFCSALSSQFEASNNQTCRQASAHCRSSGRESPVWTWTRGGRRSHGVRPLAGIRVLVRRFLPRDAELGDELVDKPGRGGTHRHNSSQGSGSHAVLYRTVVAGFPTGRQGPHGRTHSRQGPHGALMNTSLRLVIHPG